MYSGMENPQLTFYAQSEMENENLTRIMTHEIAHSWFGNTVTYKNVEHYWLNEGFTTFLTSNMIAKVHGTPEQGLWEALEWDKLKREIEDFEERKWPFLALVNNLTGEEVHQIIFKAFSSSGIPPVAGSGLGQGVMSKIQYQKGSIFLWYLQNLVGQKQFFHFLKKYLREFAFLNVDSQDFKHFFDKSFPSRNCKKI